MTSVSMGLKIDHLVVKSYSKINLTLHVIGNLENGYHDLDMVVLPLSLHDVIDIQRLPSARETYVICDEPLLMKNHNNLCSQAVAAMRAEFGFADNFSISIHKQIPYAAGLGGGSSNAAAVMKAINKMLGLNADPERLKKVALSLGADVPFFLDLKPSRIQGIGDKISKISVKNNYYALVVKPKQGLKTKDVYAGCDKFLPTENHTDDVVLALAKGDDKALPSLIQNDLFEPACELYPELRELVQELKDMGFAIAMMTGSGSAYYALSTDRLKVAAAERKLLNKDYDVYVAKTTFAEEKL